MNHFLVKPQHGTTWALDADEAHHATRVLRWKAGHPISLMDGKGNRYSGVLDDVSAGTIAEVTLVESEPMPTRPLTLAVALTKNMDRFEWMVEKAVELGVWSIFPLICRHSERKHHNHERLLRLVVSAAKQSATLWMPQVHHPVSLDALLAQTTSTPGFLAHCQTGTRVSLHELRSKTGPVAVAIGPEGDFSEEEIIMAQEAGWQGLDLGAKRLRTETAGLAVCLALSL